MMDGPCVLKWFYRGTAILGRTPTASVPPLPPAAALPTAEWRHAFEYLTTQEQIEQYEQWNADKAGHEQRVADMAREAGWCLVAKRPAYPYVGEKYMVWCLVSRRHKLKIVVLCEHLVMWNTE